MASSRSGSRSRTGNAKKSGSAAGKASNQKTKQKNTAAKGTGRGKGRANASGKTAAASSERRIHERAARKAAYTDYRVGQEIWVCIVAVLSILLALSNFRLTGRVGNTVSTWMFGVFGLMAYAIPFILFFGYAFFIANRENPLIWRKMLGLLLCILFLCAFLHLLTLGYTQVRDVREYYRLCADERTGGGIVGGALIFAFGYALGAAGAYVLTVFGLVVAAIVLTQRPLLTSLGRKGGKAARVAREQVRIHRLEQKEFKRIRREADYDDAGGRYYSDLDEEYGVNPLDKVTLEPREEMVPKKTVRRKKAAPEPVKQTLELSDILEEIRAIEGENGETEAAIARENPQLFSSGGNASGGTSPAAPAAEGGRKGGGRKSSGRKGSRGKASAEAEAGRSGAGDLPGGAFGGAGGDPSGSGAFEGGAFGDGIRDLSGSGAFGDGIRDLSGSGAFGGAAGDLREGAIFSMPSFLKKASSSASAAFYTGPEKSVGPDPLDMEMRGSGDGDAAAGGGAFMEEPSLKNGSAGGGFPEEASAGGGFQEVSAEDGFPEEAPAGVASRREASAQGSSFKDRAAETEDGPDGKEGRRRSPQREKASSPAEKEAGILSITREIARESAPAEVVYQLPPMELLKPGKPARGNSRQELMETAAKLQQTLDNFGVSVKVVNVSCGPTVTRYELQPDMGVKVSRIINLQDDIKLNLATADIRIEAPIPGKAAVGIEVPNKEVSPVMLHDILDCPEFRNTKASLPFAVGKDIGGRPIISDIEKMPHLLIAGATGSGKSVCINTLIMSILYSCSPEDVKMLMIDPKVVELKIYDGIPHLLIPVVTDAKKAAGALNWAVQEMTERYNKFAKLNGVRDIKSYNRRVKEMAKEGEAGEFAPMPRIIVIVDELADLMMVASSEVEDAICRLAQLARAAGIHIIIATQRPSVNVVTGLIKANMPSRIALAVTSGTDSRTILDMNGAEKLLGKGDMLFYPQGYPKPARVQGGYVSDGEITEVVNFLTSQGKEVEYNKEVENQISSGAMTGAAGGGDEERDEYFADSGRLIIEKEKASIGMLQRAFKIGFNRAARIMDQLCEAGVVGGEEGTKPRKILMTMAEFEELLAA